MLNYQTETNISTNGVFGVFALGDKVPKIHEKAWIAPTALVIGDVEIDEGASIWMPYCEGIEPLFILASTPIFRMDVSFTQMEHPYMWAIALVWDIELPYMDALLEPDR